MDSLINDFRLRDGRVITAVRSPGVFVFTKRQGERFEIYMTSSPYADGVMSRYECNWFQTLEGGKESGVWKIHVVYSHGGEYYSVDFDFKGEEMVLTDVMVRSNFMDNEPEFFEILKRFMEKDMLEL